MNNQSAPELLDVFDDFGRSLGVADRKTVHTQGLWHQVFHLLIVANRAGTPTVVLQKRALAKRAFPGLLDLSATGHLMAGEKPTDGVRELKEEIGIDVAPEELIPLGIRRLVDETPEGVNREFCHVYLVHDDRPLTTYRPDPTEVDAVVDLPIEPGLSLLASKHDEVECEIVDVDQVRSKLMVTRNSLVPEGSGPQSYEVSGFGYWSTVLIMAARSAAGETILSI